MPASAIPPDGYAVENFPQDGKPQVPPEELVRRQCVEAERLAGLSPDEWRLWIDASVARLGVPRAPFEDMVKARVAAKEKARREQKADEERARRDAEKAATRKRQERAKSTEREFKVLAELPEREQDARLDSLARRLGEDPAAVREEFARSPARRPLKVSSLGRTRSRPRRCWRS